MQPMPPMMDDGMGGMMDNGMEGAGQNFMQQPNDGQFDTNFDAGVEADEETDPKKYIQQLTGKLSQSLRKYNDDLGQPDIDLNKYVAGMINKQATEGLSEQDVDEIIQKIKSGEPIEDAENDGQGQGMQEPQMGNEVPNDQMQQVPQQNESRQSRSNLIDELTNNILNGTDDEEPYHKTNEKGGFRKKPFSSPNFE